MSPLSSPRIFSTSTSSLLPPTSTSLLPHFNPPKKSPPLPSSFSAARLHLLALTCLASSKFNRIANPDNQNPLPPLFLCVWPFRAPLRQTNTNSSPRIGKNKRKTTAWIGFLSLLLSCYRAPAVPLRLSDLGGLTFSLRRIITALSLVASPHQGKKLKTPVRFQQIYYCWKGSNIVIGISARFCCDSTIES